MSEPISIDDLTADWFVGPGSVVYDIGACHGHTAAMYLQRGAATVFGFEPLASNQARIPNEVRDHPAFRLMPFALSDRSGPRDILVPPEHPGAATLSESFSRRYLRGAAPERLQVDVHTIDELQLPRASFWKIDVEGAELEVLQGADRTLRQQPPDVVQIEIFSYDMSLFGKTLSTLDRYFPHLWAIGLTAERLPVHYPVTPETVLQPKFHADVRRAGTPHYYASHRGCREWIAQSERRR